MNNSTSRAKRRATSGGQRPTSSASQVLADGTLVEMIRVGKGGRTAFVTSKGGSWQVVDEVRSDTGARLRPFRPENSLLSHGVVLLPGEPLEYGSRGSLRAELRAHIHRYCDLDPLFLEITVHYVLLSWVHDVFNELPYLRVSGPPGCGKSRYLLVSGGICYRPIVASAASTVSPLFRIMDSMRGTLVLDEADFRVSDEKSSIVKILNHGTVRGFPVLRSESSGRGGEYSPRAFEVFGPKILATRGEFQDDALESRFIREHLGGRRMRKGVPIGLDQRHAVEAAELRSKLLMFRLRERAATAGTKLDLSQLEPRIQQVFRPLLSLVDDRELATAIIGRARAQERQLTSDRGLALEGWLLEAVHDVIATGAKTVAIKDVAAKFQEKHARDVQVRVTPTWIGAQLRRRLGLATERRNYGYVVAPAERGRLEVLFERFGLGGRVQL